MATETIYVVQTWVPGKRSYLQADKPMPFMAKDALRRDMGPLNLKEHPPSAG